MFQNRLIRLMGVGLATVHAWTLPAAGPLPIVRTRHQSTPFELDYYGDDENPYENDHAALTCPPDTKLVLGVNKYSHDTSICAANAKTGQVLFALSKERLSRKKHDSGNIANLVETCLESLELDLSAIEKVVMNNHHHRILPLEKDVAHMAWEAGLRINGGAEDGYDDPENLLPDAERLELSHHLAHAYSTATQAPFDSGMVVVLDGMGEAYKTMKHAEETNDPTYVSDLTFGEDTFQCIPSDMSSQHGCFDWREAESVYVFEKKGTTVDLRPIFKRFSPEQSPPTLFNHGFENMESVGALYSRAASHIFGDWNACGKVMGMAPWIGKTWTDLDKTIKPNEEARRIVHGTLYSEEDGKKFHYNRNVLTGEPLYARMDPELFDQNGVKDMRYDFDDYEGTRLDDEEEARKTPSQVALDAISVAHRIQVDLEDVVLDFVKHFKTATDSQNLCIAGGVGLNSVLNGRISRELGFKSTYVSPYPGDEGVSVGCCAFGLFGNEQIDRKRGAGATGRPPLWQSPLSPYLGPHYSEEQIKAAIEEAKPWLEVEVIRNEKALADAVAQEIESGGIVAWYQARSEMGPRALGHRSILADPRNKRMVRLVNKRVKNREAFRPFAPSVLLEHAADWFDLSGSTEDSIKSPYMSLTAMVRENKRDQIPAVTHVDGSARLHTVDTVSEPGFHRLISRFFELTGIPIVLNTSFNTIPGEPVVESPKDAIRSFLSSMGGLDMLVIGDYIVKAKDADLRSLLGEANKEEDLVLTEPRCPKRTGEATFKATFDAVAGFTEDKALETHSRVLMKDRPTYHESSPWFDLMDELEAELLSVCDGTNTLNDIMAHYAAVDEGEEMTDEEVNNAKTLLQNMVHRLVRLYDNTLISW